TTRLAEIETELCRLIALEKVPPADVRVIPDVGKGEGKFNAASYNNIFAPAANAALKEANGPNRVRFPATAKTAQKKIRQTLDAVTALVDLTASQDALLEQGTIKEADHIVAKHMRSEKELTANWRRWMNDLHTRMKNAVTPVA